MEQGRTPKGAAVGKRTGRSIGKATRTRTLPAASAVHRAVEISPAHRARRPAHSGTRGSSELPRRAGFIVDVLGNRVTARLLGVSESQPSRWRRAGEIPSPRLAPLLVDLDHVIGRLLLVWDRAVVADWLTSSNAFLTGARPIDVLVTRGSSEVVEAIDAEAAGAFA